MADRVLLHVGTPKSGTSFLQRIVHGNRDGLRERGLLVPAEPGTHFQGTLAVREAAPDPAGEEFATRAWARLVEAAREWDGDVLITHELFAGATSAQARRALHDLAPEDVHVVITARDLVRQIPAEWQEHVKHGSTIDLARFVDAVVTGGAAAEWFWRVQDVADLARRWGEPLPPGHVHIVTVPPSGAAPATLWARFACVLGVDPAAYPVETDRANESLGAAQVEFLRRVNRERATRFDSRGQHRWFKNRLAHAVLAQQPGSPRFEIDEATRAWAVERGREMAEKLRAGGYDVVGDLGDLVPDPVAEAAGPPDPTDEELLEVAARGTVALLAMVRDEVGELEALRPRLADTERRLRETSAALDDLRRHAAAVEEELRRWRSRPMREQLIRLSEEHPPLMRLRVVYWNAVNAARRIDPRRLRR